MIADISDLDGFIYSGMAGAALGALISVFLNFRFQKMLLQQQLEFQQRLLDQQIAAQEQGHKEHLEHMTKMASSGVQDHTANRQSLCDNTKLLIAAIEKLKSIAEAGSVLESRSDGSETP